MRTIAFINAKGGTGKTTSTLICAEIFATKYNKKVLVIDLDPQRNTSEQLINGDLDVKGVAHLLINNANISEIICKSKIPNIDIIPCDHGLEFANQQLLISVTSMIQLRLKKHISSVRKHYDYCIIDCPTAIKNISTINGLAFTDDVIVPISTDNFSIKAINNIMSVISDVQEYNENINLCGVLITKWENNKLCKKTKERLLPILGEKMFNTSIRKTIKMSEGTFENDKTLISYAKNSTAVEDYYKFIDEYLKKIKSI